MLARLNKLREERDKGDNGFTLIELLVVVVILGILIAIAIPLYLNYRKGANDASAKSDLRGAVSTLEQCQADNATYPTLATAVTITAPSGSVGGLSTSACTQTINLSSGTSLLYKSVATSGTSASYMAATTNSNGSPKYYCYNSATGGSVTAVSTATSLATATC